MVSVRKYFMPKIKKCIDSVEIIVENQETLELVSLMSKPYIKPPKLTMTHEQTNLPLPQVTLTAPLTIPTVSPQSPLTFPNREEVGLLIKAIPEYSPGDNLSIFINEVDALNKHLQNRLTSDLVYIFNSNIRSKIRGEARDYIAYQNASNWDDIRKCLLQKYGDQRSEDLLVTDMTQCVQKKTETYLDYYGRLLKTFNALMQNITLNYSDQNLLTFKKNEYEKQALKTFLSGVLEPYRSHLSHFELPHIEKYLNKCHELDNKRQEWEYSEFLRKSQETPGPSSQKHLQNPFKLTPNHTPSQPLPQYRPVPQTPRLNFNPPQNQYQLKAAFPKPPFQNPRPYNRPFIQQKPFNPTFQRSNNFQPFQRPAFGPSLNPPKLPPPEPMSVQSRVRSNQIPNPKPWHSLNNVEADGVHQEHDQLETYNERDQFETYQEYDYNCTEQNEYYETENVGETEGNFPEPASNNTET